MKTARTYKTTDHIEVRIIETPLSDGSLVFAVALIDRGAESVLNIPAVSEDHAKKLAKVVHNAIIDHATVLSTIHFDTGY